MKIKTVFPPRAIWRLSPLCPFAQYSQNWFGLWTWLIWFSVRYSEHGKVLSSVKGGVTEDRSETFLAITPGYQQTWNVCERFVSFIYNSKELSVFLCIKSDVANHCSLCNFLSDMHFFCGNAVASWLECSEIYHCLYRYVLGVPWCESQCHAYVFS